MGSKPTPLQAAPRPLHDVPPALTRRPRAGVDLDNVLYDWEGHARRILRLWHGLDLPVSTHYHSIRDACTPEQWAWLWDVGVRRLGLFRSGPALLDALAEVPRLMETHDVAVITKRPRSAIRDTHEWLAERGVFASEVVMLHDGDPREKSAVPCDWYVDDSAENAEELWLAGKKVYLLDRPWNHKMTDPKFFVSGGVVRVRDWHELMGRL